MERLARARKLLELEPDRGTDQPVADQVLERLARAGRFRDEETAEHVERMSRSCALLARALGWDPAACRDLRAAAALHDIGKIGVPDAVLRKPGKLTPDERALIEEHAQIGHDILVGSDDPVLQLAATVALTHHERFDGGGYPSGLRAEAVPLAGRIAAVADVFDALTHDRIYRSAFTVGEARDMLYEGRATQFDPVVLDAFATVLPEVEDVRRLYRDERGGSDDSATFFGWPEAPIRVLIVEDHEAISRGLELLLRRDGIEIAGSASTLAEARRLLGRRAVDVVVLDLALQGEDGLELVPLARERAAKVLLYTGSTDPATLAAATAAGADGVAGKAASPAEFVAAVRSVAGGESYLDPHLPSRPAEQGDDSARLTARECEIVQLLSQGLSGEDIAQRLYLAPTTVRTHLRNAMRRTNTKSRAQLVAVAAATQQISIDA